MDDRISIEELHRHQQGYTQAAAAAGGGGGIRFCYQLNGPTLKFINRQQQ